MYIGEVCFCLFLLWMGYFLWQWKKGKSHQFLFYEGVEKILRFCREKMGMRITGTRLEQYKKLYPGQSEETIFYTYYGKLGCTLAVTVAAGLFLAAVSGLVETKSQLLEGYFIEREGTLGNSKNVSLDVTAEEEEKEVTIDVPQKSYTKKELQAAFQKAEEYVEQTYLGENASDEEVDKPLVLVSEIPDSAITVSWQTSGDGLINEDGTLENQKLEESRQTKITAILSYGEEEKEVVKMVTILPVQRTKEELFWKEWQRQMKKTQKESAAKEYFELPREVEGKQITYQEVTTQLSYSILGMLLLALIAILLLGKEKMRKKEAKREEELQAAYPDFVEQFVLLIGAGLNIKGAWERIVYDYKREKEKRGFQYVYEEMEVALQEIHNGMGEAQAYELFGKRTGLLPYMKFCTLLVQNLKKGSDDLLQLLDYEVTDAFQERKENAKALGEKAGTKLLLPMMLMLVIVFVLILYAAFQGM